MVDLDFFFNKNLDIVKMSSRRPISGPQAHICNPFTRKHIFVYVFNSLAGMTGVGGCPLNSGNRRKGGRFRSMWAAASASSPFNRSDPGEPGRCQGRRGWESLLCDSFGSWKMNQVEIG